MHSQPASPGPTYSDGGGTPGRAGFGLLSSLKKALPNSPRPHSPASSIGGSFAGSEAGTPPSRTKLGFPSFTNSQRKRDTIKKLEEDVSLLQMQLHQRDGELIQLQQQAAAEAGARLEAQERLNMQYFKSHLLADMLVAKLLDLEGVGMEALPAAAAAAGTATATAAAPQPAAAVPRQQPHVVPAGLGSGSVLRESSFD